MWYRIPICALMLLLSVSCVTSRTVRRLEDLSKQGVIIGVEDAKRFPHEKQPVKDDTGYNVLIDMAHQCNFATMWHLPVRLWERGYRAVGSHATLDTVLTPGEAVCARIQAGDRRPFAWWPNARYNVVITHQASDTAPIYLPEEIEALERFVRDGGGLIIAAGAKTTDKGQIEKWSLNALASRFGAGVAGKIGKLNGQKANTWLLSEEWKTERKADNGLAAIARRAYGRGRVVVVADIGLINFRTAKTSEEQQEEKGRLLSDVLGWAVEGAQPVGGTLRLPRQRGGAGAIYPEKTKRIGNIRLFYARNAKPELLECVDKDIPVVKQTIMNWLPSPTFDEEPVNLILAAGGGGGWAVNAYLPKEAGCISPAPINLISVFAHEFAHTLSGPASDGGAIAGRAPHGNKGEAHAGWFQTKALYLFTNGEKHRDSNAIFKVDPDGTKVDLAGFKARRAKNDPAEHPVGTYRQKIYWIWQKLDERYGPEWYPRWRWTQHTRREDDPDHALTWDEMAEDMSIAVGEDLFPFFRKIGTTLEKERFERAVFQGQTLELPVAHIEITKVGPPITRPLVNWRKL